MQTLTLGGSMYIFMLIDYCTLYSWIYFLQSKDQALDRFRIFKELVETQYNLKIKVSHTDRGGEFLLNNFKLYYEDNRI